MAWQEVETDVGNKVGTTKYSVKMKHGGARVSIPAAVREKLGWTEKTAFKLLVGGGDMAGKLRIEAAAKGKIVGRKPPLGGGGLIIRLGRWPTLAPRDVDAITVESEIEGGALVIVLPLHAQAVAPVPRPSVSIMGGSQPTPAATKTDVSDRFFNDPKRPPVMASGTRGVR